LRVDRQSILGESARKAKNSDSIFEAHIFCTAPEIIDQVKVGEPILFDDGKIKGVITEIHNEDKSVLLVELLENNQKHIFLKGGKGGLGNSHFKSSTNQAPRQFTNGEALEEQWIWLSLKLFADVGIIGLPNAGKSTFLSKISNAQPKVADYPFTTLHPVLGVIKQFDKEIVLADIPGLIEGAHEGKGLGDKFLAHIERCKILLHLIDSSDPNWKENYNVIRKELEKYGQNLSQKEEVIALSKEDLNPEMTNTVINEMTKLNTNKKFSISSFNNNGVEDLTSYLFEKCEIEDDQ